LLRQVDHPSEEMVVSGRTDVLVVAAVRMYEDGLAQVLGGDPRFRVVGSASTGRGALASLERPPAVVLLDLGIDEGLATLRELRRAWPETAVVALAVRDVHVDVVAWAEAGAAGIVPREASLSRLADVVESVAGGESLCSPRTAAALLRRVAALAEGEQAARLRPLTRREQEIARLIERGLSNKEIASRLTIELPTVKNHVHAILEKLSVNRRAEAGAVLRGRGVGALAPGDQYPA
jgi:two-component system, NarL family, nitrate/nitrite response regulator NarL